MHPDLKLPSIGSFVLCTMAYCEKEFDKNLFMTSQVILFTTRQDKTQPLSAVITI